MQAGRRDRQLTLRRKMPAADDEFGAETSTWTDLVTVWAAKQDLSDSERIRAQQIGASLTTRFQLPPLDGQVRPSVEDQLLCEGVAYEVTGVKEIGRRGGWEISASAQAT